MVEHGGSLEQGCEAIAPLPLMSLATRSRVQDLYGVRAVSEPGVWDAATMLAANLLPSAARPRTQEGAALAVAGLVLLEGQYGPQHYRLGRAKRLYYRMRPLMTPTARRVLRHAIVRRSAADFGANWPIDDRYVNHVEKVLEAACTLQPGLSDLVRPFWPKGKRFALVLTHDVESTDGLARIWDLVELEERFGVRSSFNLVAGDYPVDIGVVRELSARGFEVGVHGWHHDGRMFESPKRFDDDCYHINQTLREWGAVGFRSPMMHRHPVPMQRLAVEYDSSFFDTDPFEPISGGAMTIWPFHMGHIVELPYTLSQDHTLIETLGDPTPRLWLQKTHFIASHRGMALLNTHPDYLCRDGNIRMYAEYLEALGNHAESWSALPREVAAWWSTRVEPGCVRRQHEGSAHDRTS